MSTELQQKLAEIDRKTVTGLTDRITLAVIEAAYTGKLDKALNERIINYIHTPYAQSVGEPAYSLHQRFTTHQVQLHTKSGLLQMLRVVEMAGGVVDKTLYRCLAPKGIQFAHIKPSDAMSILTQGQSYLDMMDMADLHEREQQEKHEVSKDFALNEQENYREVAR